MALRLGKRPPEGHTYRQPPTRFQDAGARRYIAFGRGAGASLSASHRASLRPRGEPPTRAEGAMEPPPVVRDPNVSEESAAGLRARRASSHGATGLRICPEPLRERLVVAVVRQARAGLHPMDVERSAGGVTNITGGVFCWQPTPATRLLRRAWFHIDLFYLRTPALPPRLTSPGWGQCHLDL